MSTERAPRSGRGWRPDLPAIIALIVVALSTTLYFAIRIAAASTENVNWDEFGVMQRTANMLRTGALQGAGRPGAVELVLAPFVAGCRNGVEAVREARQLWNVVAAALLLGLFELVRRAAGGGARGALAGSLAVALYASVPAFLRWSLQVRTDQFAVAFALWAGVCFLISRERRAFSALAGVLAGTAYLFNQKAVYVGLLVAVVGIAFGRTAGAADRSTAGKDLLVRCGWVVIGGAAVWLGFRFGVSAFLEPAPFISVRGGLKDFEYYREFYGLRVYAGLLPHLLPHGVLAVLLIATTLDALGHRKLSLGSIAAWSILGAGALVGTFHAGALPWFWMTLGLFPAVSLSLSTAELLEHLPDRRVAALLVMALLAWVIIPQVAYARSLLRDTQSVQFEALEFVERNFPPEAAGFQQEGALFCRDDPEPFRVMYRMVMRRLFETSVREREVERLVEAFKRKPVRFVIHFATMNEFPEPVVRLWNENYLQYAGPVRVAGRRIQGEQASTVRLPIFVPGDYRLWLAADSAGARIRIGDAVIGGGQSIALAAGQTELGFLNDVRHGALILNLPEPPYSTSDPWYALGPTREMRGLW